MVHGVVRPIITQPLLYPTCGINLLLLTACIFDNQLANCNNFIGVCTVY